LLLFIDVTHTIVKLVRSNIASWWLAYSWCFIV